MVIFWVKTNKTKKTPSQHSLTTITRENYTSSTFGSSFGSCWGGVHQFCSSMDNILRNLESLSRIELVWLSTYLVGRLRALPPENDSHPAVPGLESPGSVAMQGPNGVTGQQEKLLRCLIELMHSTPLWTLGSAQGLRRKAGRLTSTRQWCRFRAISN